MKKVIKSSINKPDSKINTYQDILEYIIDHYYEEAVSEAYHRFGNDATDIEIASEATEIAITWYIDDYGTDIYDNQEFSNMERQIYDEYLYKVRHENLKYLN